LVFDSGSFKGEVFRHQEQDGGGCKDSLSPGELVTLLILLASSMGAGVARPIPEDVILVGI
jgi:hypothetical protein